LPRAFHAFNEGAQALLRIPQAMRDSNAHTYAAAEDDNRIL